MSDFRTIPLTRGLEAVVDAADYEALSAFKWYAHDTGRGLYAARRERPSNVFVYMHRQITDAPAGLQVDHANGDRLDNRRANLRPCSSAQNSYNIAPKPGTASGFKGVTQHRAKWAARIWADGVLHRVGRFDTAEEAAKSYDSAAARLHGAFAYLNFPEAV